jgi:predicted Rossmann-fold nucleotide-binding protein
VTRTIELPADLPYDPFRTSLYTRDELVGDGLDKRIEQHVLDHGFRAPPAPEALAQRLHDHHIDVALSELLSSRAGVKVAGVMGSAATARTDPWYRRAAELARGLTRAGHFVASGGGPGIMEAANLGAFLSGHDDRALDEALEVLSRAPAYDDGKLDGYVDAAGEVRDRFAPGAESLAIPTWFYPGEPVGQFASHIAKYFANSIREDGLVTIAVSGIVFAPGRAGTMQELFQDAAQNAYCIRGQSPMVLLGSDYWDGDPSIYAVLHEEAGRFGGYGHLVTVLDDPAEAVAFIDEKHPRELVSKLRDSAPHRLLDFLRNERMPLG